MYNHEPPGYECPLCELVRGGDNAEPWAKQSDVVYRDDHVIAWINSKWWGRIEGNVVVVPNEHVENIFDLDAELAGRIHLVARYDRNDLYREPHRIVPTQERVPYADRLRAWFAER